MLVAAIAVGVVLVYLFFILPTQWLKVEKIRHPSGINKRILQISDLHVDRLRISARTIGKVIEETRPDYIFMTGDYTYKTSYLPRANDYFKVIAGYGVPVYAVLGNHDYELPRLSRLLDLLQTNGIRLLRNECVPLPEFDLVGIDDFGTGHSKLRPAFRGADGRKPIVVMTHDPNVVLAIKRPYHYLMAGHLHGKQLNVPFFFKLKPKGPLADRGIYKGLHKSGEGYYYISKGIGQAGVNARFMVRSELTVHDL
ncbi:metallophosphoesterase [Paenibacillus arenilitoris]|uniref:Metallophosphoesterase n=1 Tax=Paenibacillus arenilitoris TaxID=2772299 RepID=A0A927CR31_9BACL|nr:metallophosphoesterase [Paenibacillus arenilitoris]MBD2872022.1 metallophosphoesterase [Paenibacillus arenilitoris]